MPHARTQPGIQPKETHMRVTVAIIIGLICWSASASGQVAVIVNKSVSLDSLDRSELLDLYSGEKTFWSNHTPVVIFDLKPVGATRDQFYQMLNISPSRVKSIWLKRMLSGDADPPEYLPDDEEMLRKVAETPGAIGFVDSTKVSGDVKVVMVRR